MFSSRSLFVILLLASPGMGQATCDTAIGLDPCGGQSSSLGPGVDLPPPCGSFPSSWASMTPALSGPLTVTNGTTGAIAAYSGDCSALSLIGCAPGSVTFNALEGSTYFFQVEGFLGVTPSAISNVISPNCAPNDGSECLQAISLDSCGSEVVPFNTDLGFVETTNCALAGAGQWFEIVPASDGVLDLTVAISSGFGVSVVVFEGDCSHLVEIACGGSASNPTSFAIVGGNRYTIALIKAGFSTVTGTLTTSSIPGSPCGPCTDCDGDSFDVSVDCNDGNSDVHPGAPEILGNGIDDDCDGVVDACSDCDGDGFPAPMDCDDTDPGVSPGAKEIPGNGIDDNCNGVVDEVFEPVTPPRRRIGPQ